MKQNKTLLGSEKRGVGRVRVQGLGNNISHNIGHSKITTTIACLYCSLQHFEELEQQAKATLPNGNYKTVTSRHLMS